jgi:hypothetical protein
MPEEVRPNKKVFVYTKVEVKQLIIDDLLSKGLVAFGDTIVDIDVSNHPARPFLKAEIKFNPYV